MKLKQSVLLISFLILQSCAENRNVSTITLNEGFDITNSIKTDVSLKKKDTREKINDIDFLKSYADIERYFRLAKDWNKIKCVPKSGFICTKHECKKREVSSFLILDKKAKLIKKCDKDICQEFKGEFEQIGVFTNVQSTGSFGTLIRVLGDNRYKEIATVGLDAYIANGNCSAIIEEKKK